MKAEIDKGKENARAVFEADNEFHEAVSLMGHNPLVNKIDKVVRMLTHELRLNTVTYMVESGSGEELFAAHLKIYQMLKEREKTGIHENIRYTYFEDRIKF